MCIRSDRMYTLCTCYIYNVSCIYLFMGIIWVVIILSCILNHNGHLLTRTIIVFAQVQCIYPYLFLCLPASYISFLTSIIFNRILVTAYSAPLLLSVVIYMCLYCRLHPFLCYRPHICKHVPTEEYLVSFLFYFHCWVRCDIRCERGNCRFLVPVSYLVYFDWVASEHLSYFTWSTQRPRFTGVRVANNVSMRDVSPRRREYVFRGPNLASFYTRLQERSTQTWGSRVAKR